MTEPLVVIGAGGFGRETIDVVRAINAAAPAPVWDLVGVADDGPSDLNLARLDALGVAFLGSVDELKDMHDVAVTIGVGSPVDRASIATRMNGWSLTTPDLIHPSAVVGSGLTTGGGLVACALVSIGTNVTLGRYVHLNPHAAVGHDTAMGNFVSINPHAAVSGDCTIEDGVFIGAAGVVLNKLTVGAHSIVGGSACVVRDVPPKSTVKGVPAA